MKNLLVIFIFSTLFLGCRKSDEKPTNTDIGSTNVDLSADGDFVRKKEAVIANFICDALKVYYIDKGETLDFVFINGGNIRYNAQIRPNGIYPKGILTAEMMDEMLPFQNTSYIVQLTGNQLKEILERAVAQYPLPKGPFMHCSKEFSFQIDTLANPQILNVDQTAIEIAGNRIDSLKFNGNLISPNETFSVLFSDYIAEGNDGFLTLKYLNPNLKKYFGDNQSSALKDFVLLNSPIEPKLEGRIIFK